MDIVIDAGFAILAALRGLVLWRLSARPAGPAGQSPEQAAELATLQAELKAALAGRSEADMDRTQLRGRLETALAAQSTAETRLTELLAQLDSARTALAAAEAARADADKDRIQHERSAAPDRPKVAEREKRLDDFAPKGKQQTEHAK